MEKKLFEFFGLCSKPSQVSFANSAASVPEACSAGHQIHNSPVLIDAVDVIFKIGQPAV